MPEFIQTFLAYSSTTGEWFTAVGPLFLGLLKSIGNIFVVVLEWIVAAIKWLLALLP